MEKWNEWVLDYYQELYRKWKAYPPIELLLPFKDKECQRVTRSFYDKYYNDQRPRQLWLGINPGRFGSGITGIAFSDPVLLEEHCGISNTWDKKKELSAEFIFEVIQAAGGPEIFYRKVYIDAISPIGYVLEGVNFNYYDKPEFFRKLKPQIESHLRSLHGRPLKAPLVIIGKGKNENFFKQLESPFKEFTSLPHPRWIMQYRRKDKVKWIDRYLSTFQLAE